MSEVDYTAPQWNPPTTPPTPGNPVRMQALADAVEECAARAINQTKADAINGGTFDAAKCTAFGMGGFATELSNQNVDNLVTPGIYRMKGSAPFTGTLPVTPDNHGDIIFVLGVNAYVTWQLYFAINSDATIGDIYFRCVNAFHGAWKAWGKLWTSANDGNGGQPPAPKPRSATGAGNFVTINGATNTAVNFPAGGQWVGYRWYFNASSYTLEQSESIVFGAGGSVCAGALSGAKAIGFMWRITE